MAMIVALMLAAAQPVVPAATPAPDWRLIGTARERSLFYDAARIERGPDVVTVRIRNQAAQAPDASPYALSRLEIRCAAAQLRVVVPPLVSARPVGIDQTELFVVPQRGGWNARPFRNA